MKVCIPTIDAGGLEATISPHFGSATFYTVVETESGAVTVVPNDSHDHGQHHSCAGPDRIRDLGADAVLCNGLGRRALARLSEGGIQVFTTDATGVRNAVAAFGAGQRAVLSENDACGGGRHGSCAH